MASFSREFAVIDTRLEYLELTRAGAMEVFAVDPAELASVHGVPVPEHGAFVGRVLPTESLEGEHACLRDAHTNAATRVWRRDAGQATVVPAPCVAPGALRAHETSLILLNDDWFVLGLRFEVDAEARRAFNLHGFASLGRGHLRCFVVPEDSDVGARVLVTVGRHALEPAIQNLDVFDHAEPPALDLLRAFVEGPTAAPSPSTRERDAERDSSASDALDEPETETSNRVRNATGLFPHQARTVRWMASVERGAEGDDDCGASLREAEPVRFGGRSLFPSGRETKTGEEGERGVDADAAAAAAAKGDRRAGRFGAARAVEAALTSAVAAKTHAKEGLFEKEELSPPLPRGGLIAHPVGAGKTVIAAALLERTRRDAAEAPILRKKRGETENEKGGTDVPDIPGNTPGPTLVTCPGHIINQWLAALRAFAPSLKCRRADARPNDFLDSVPAGEKSAPDDKKKSAGLERLDPDALPDWSPLRGGVGAWDVLVVANEDLPRGRRDARLDTRTENRETVANDPCVSRIASARAAPFHPLWNDPFEVPDPESIEWFRVIVDEPQELVFDWRPAAAERGAGAWLVERLRAKHRWALSATPGASDVEKRDVLSLTFGRRVSRLEFRRVRARWFARRTVRDPPDACLPRVSLNTECVPVTLSWREAAAVQLYTEALDATFGNVVRLCGGWRGAARGHLAAFFGDDLVVDSNGLSHDDDDDDVPNNVPNNIPTERESLEAWHARLTRARERSLERLETRRDALAAALAEAERRGAARLAAEGGYNPFDQLDDLLTEEALMDDGDGDVPGSVGWGGEGGGALDLGAMRLAMRASMRAAAAASGLEREDDFDFEGLGGDNDAVDPVDPIDPIAAARLELDAVHAALDRGRRDLAFVAAAAAALRDETAECSVCFERLRGKTVTVLRCAHAFDAACVAQLLLASSRRVGHADARVVHCPLCRAPTRRKNMCTFAHREDGGGGGADDAAEKKTAARADGDRREDDTTTTTTTTTISTSAKTSALVSTVASILRARPDDKIVVFAQWPDAVAACASAAAAAAAESKDAFRPDDVLTLLGDATTRALSVARFQSEQKDSPRVLFVSHQHHASGLNLHVASHVIVAHPYAAPVTSPTAPELAALSAAAAFERQAVGRVRRFPQTKPCRLYRLYARGTVEEELYAVWGWI